MGQGPERLSYAARLQFVRGVRGAKEWFEHNGNQTGGEGRGIKLNIY